MEVSYKMVSNYSEHRYCNKKIDNILLLLFKKYNMQTIHFFCLLLLDLPRTVCPKPQHSVESLFFPEAK